MYNAGANDSSRRVLRTPQKPLSRGCGGGGWVDKASQTPKPHLVSVRVAEAGLVDLGLVLDVPSTIGVLEGVQRLLKVAVSNSHACNHEGSAVAAQRVLYIRKTEASQAKIAMMFSCKLLSAMVGADKHESAVDATQGALFENKKKG